MRVTPYHLQPATGVFIATVGSEVVCTVTLIQDSSAGLPIDDVYGDEINIQRDNGLKLAEVSSLAAIPGLTQQTFWKIFMKLTSLIAQSARRQGVDGLVLAAHPRHARFYGHLMGFRQIGDLRSYPAVRNRPAVACYLDFAQVDVTRPPCYEEIFGERLPKVLLRWSPMCRGGTRVLPPCRPVVPLCNSDSCNGWLN